MNKSCKKRIPYGIADFRRIKRENYYYIDKTHYIEEIEKQSPFLFFIRPRRFGKSLFLNMLAFYYDVFYKDESEEVLGDTYIFSHPTQEASKYYILKFDFSAVSTVGNIDDNFSYYSNIDMEFFIDKYKLPFRIDKTLPAHHNLKGLLNYCRKKELPVYLMIDEYDNFINNILMHDEDEYHKLVSSKSEAIYKEFFKLLKSATTDNSSPLKKMFITGVSPLALFDVTSGSNIGSNITTELAFYNAVGISKAELKKLLNYYDLSDINIFDDWYNHYKFSVFQNETVYNTSMVLYYIKTLVLTGRRPINLVDVNIRTDYSKLRYLVYTNNSLNGNFDVLRRLFGDGEISAIELKDTFSAFELKDTDNFTSLLYYLGLTTLSGVRYGEYYFKIPNQTIRIIMSEYMQKILDESALFNINLNEFKKTIQSLAYKQSLEVFDFLAKEINENSGIRDYIDGENFIKGFLVAYLSLAPYYSVLTENETNKGFVDIRLKKAPNVTDDIIEPVIELKYIPRNKYSKKLLHTKIKEAKDQLNKYNPQSEGRGIIVVFNGWELVYREWNNKNEGMKE